MEEKRGAREQLLGLTIVGPRAVGLLDEEGRLTGFARYKKPKSKVEGVTDPELRARILREYRGLGNRPGWIHPDVFEAARGRVVLSDLTPTEPRESFLERAAKEPLQFESEFMARDHFARWLEIFEPGLKLYQSENGRSGVEFACEIGRIDILAVDRSGGFLVIEIKLNNRHFASALGQVMRYMGWVRANLAREGQAVRGAILTNHITESLRLAVSEASNVTVFEFIHSLAVIRHDPEGTPGTGRGAEPSE